MTIDLDAHLATASLTVRTVPVCLDGEAVGAYMDALDALEAYREHPDSPPDPAAKTLTSKTWVDERLADLEQAVETAKTAVAERSLPFKIRGLTRPAYTALLAAHPPREGDVTDKRYGYNDETFTPALVRACLVDPSPTEEQWPALEALLVFGQHDDLAAAAIAASRRRVDVPFSSTASGKTRKTAGQ